MSATTATVEETIGSLTGFDEIAIARAFNAEWSDLAEHRPSTFTRALVFILLRRDGQEDTEAKNAVLEMTLQEVKDYFMEEEEETVPEEPVTPSGKDSEQPEMPPKN